MKEEELSKILSELNGVYGVNNSVITGLDGLPVLWENSSDVSLISAASVAALGAIEEMLRQVGEGSLENILVESDSEKVFIKKIKNELVLILFAQRNANLGLIRLEMRRATKKIENILAKSIKAGKKSE